MHSIVIARRRRSFNLTNIDISYVELETLDDDEFDIDDELSKLMDQLNDTEDPAIQEFARNRCKFLGWGVERIYDPADYYADNTGYVWCIDLR